MQSRALTAGEWTTILEWCDTNLKDKRFGEAIQHFAQPENGGYVLKLGTLQKRWKEWEEAKEIGQDPVFRIHQAKLTDSDWVRVFEYMDEHHGYNQDKIAEYFEREEGLKFHRTTLGMKLRDREAIEHRVSLAANAAEGKGKAQLPHPHPKKAAGRRESSRAGSTSSPSATPSAGPSRMPVLKTYSSRPSRKAKKGVSLKEPEVEDVPSRGLPAKQWVKIFQFVDKNPSMNKAEVARHFAAQGVNFPSGTLRRRLRERAAAESCSLEEAKKAKEAQQRLSSEKTEVKPPKKPRTLSFSSQRWSSRLAKAPPSLSSTRKAIESNSASHSPDEDESKRNADEDLSEDGEGDDGNKDEGGEEGGEEEVFGTEEEESQADDSEDSEKDEGEEGPNEEEEMLKSDDDRLTPLPESPPRPRPSLVGTTIPPNPIPQPLLALTTSSRDLSPLPSVGVNSVASPDDASTPTNLGTQGALSGEPVALSAPPRFKRKRSYHTNTSHTDSLLEGEPDEKRARLRASRECDTIPTPSLSTSSLPTASESSASSRSTPMSPSESHIHLPHSSHIDIPSVLGVEDEGLLDLPSLSCSLSVPGFTRDPHPRESLSLRSRLWDAWLP